ncbi:DNA cytosine methyltransferase [Hahella ganghwensis]|uniref:DNA cytosine methyltransferase n=1 Tax=Hahella ganghwensis TaxID=286420 RepID=UPI00039FB814|nr:DNA cytosine methyltransferase [Hahella ganghwensis]
MPEAKKPTFIDVFAGCGGLSLGLVQAGWKGLCAIEKDINAFQSLYDNLVVTDRGDFFDWPEWLPQKALSVDEVLGDYGEKLASLSGQVDMLVGGPPCQGFSTAGRRDPNDPRNSLVEAYIEFVNLICPKIVLIENVKGITHDFDSASPTEGKINYARKIIDALSEKYRVHSQLLDTSTFGVPQNRHRFFIVAIRLDLCDAIDSDPFEIIERDRYEFLRLKGLNCIPVTSESAISDFEVSRNGKTESRDTKGFEEILYRGAITNYQKIMNAGLGDVTNTRLARHQPHIVDRFEKIIKNCQESGRLNVALSAELKASFGLRKCAIRVLDPNSTSPTITSMPDDLIHYKEPRTLTVRENARLQSFPDWFEFKGKYTTGGDRRKKEVPRFTQVANAVPPLVAEAIGRTFDRILRENQVSGNSLAADALESQIGLDVLIDHVVTASCPHS